MYLAYVVCPSSTMCQLIWAPQKGNFGQKNYMVLTYTQNGGQIFSVNFWPISTKPPPSWRRGMFVAEHLTDFLFREKMLTFSMLWIVGSPTKTPKKQKKSSHVPKIGGNYPIFGIWAIRIRYLCDYAIQYYKCYRKLCYIPSFELNEVRGVEDISNWA